jgi:hypothetical protein
VAADACAGQVGAVAMASAGGDEKRGGVSEDALFGAAAVVSARGEIDGGELTAAAGRVGGWCQVKPFARGIEFPTLTSAEKTVACDVSP